MNATPNHLQMTLHLYSLLFVFGSTQMTEEMGHFKLLMHRELYLKRLSVCSQHSMKWVQCYFRKHIAFLSTLKGKFSCAFFEFNKQIARSR